MSVKENNFKHVIYQELAIFPSLEGIEIPEVLQPKYELEYDKSCRLLREKGFNGTNIPIIHRVNEDDMKFCLVDYAHKITVARIYKGLAESEKARWVNTENLLLSGCGVSVLVESSDGLYALPRRNNRTFVDPNLVSMFGEGFSDLDIDPKEKTLDIYRAFKRCIREELQLEDSILTTELLCGLWNYNRPSFDFIAKVKISLSGQEIIAHFERNQNIDKLEHVNLSLFKPEDLARSEPYFSDTLKYIVSRRSLLE